MTITDKTILVTGANRGLSPALRDELIAVAWREIRASVLCPASRSLRTVAVA